MRIRKNLEEVVVIGYGTSKAKDLTAPIAVIKADEITKHATSSPMSALQGKVPGVQITNSGQPGSGPSVRIRGIGSMNTDSQPLYVVDGMFFDNIDFLNNSDIQDLSILKDASAASNLWCTSGEWRSLGYDKERCVESSCYGYL